MVNQVVFFHNQHLIQHVDSPENETGSHRDDTLVTCDKEWSIKFLGATEKSFVHKDKGDGDGPVGGDHPQDVGVALEQRLLPCPLHPLMCATLDC